MKEIEITDFEQFVNLSNNDKAMPADEPINSRMVTIIESNKYFIKLPFVKPSPTIYDFLRHELYMFRKYYEAKTYYPDEKLTSELKKYIDNWNPKEEKKTEKIYTNPVILSKEQKQFRKWLESISINGNIIWTLEEWEKIIGKYGTEEQMNEFKKDPYYSPEKIINEIYDKLEK